MTKLVIQWMSQTSRLQAFLILSSLVLLVESLVGGSPTYFSSSRVAAFVVKSYYYKGGWPSTTALAYSNSDKDQDMAWNSTAMAMNAAQMAATASASVSHSSSSATTTTASSSIHQENGLERTKGSEQAQPPATPSTTQTRMQREFQPTVSHSTLDHWFHVLGGMEDQRILNSQKRGLWGRRKTFSIHEATSHQRHAIPPHQQDDDNSPPSASPTPAPMPNNNNNQDPNSSAGGNKPTDHWMF